MTRKDIDRFILTRIYYSQPINHRGMFDQAEFQDRLNLIGRSQLVDAIDGTLVLNREGKRALYDLCEGRIPPLIDGRLELLSSSPSTGKHYIVGEHEVKLVSESSSTRGRQLPRDVESTSNE